MQFKSIRSKHSYYRQLRRRSLEQLGYRNCISILLVGHILYTTTYALLFNPNVDIGFWCIQYLEQRFESKAVRVLGSVLSIIGEVSDAYSLHLFHTDSHNVVFNNKKDAHKLSRLVLVEFLNVFYILTDNSFEYSGLPNCCNTVLNVRSTFLSGSTRNNPVILVRL